MTWLKSYGLRICLFHQAFVPPGYTREELREHYDGKRELPGLDEAIVESSRELAAAMFTHLPEIDSLLFHSLECEWFWGNAVAMLPAEDDAAAERGLDAYLRGLTRACEEHGKDLLFWTHVSNVSMRQFRLMHRVLERHPAVVVVEDAVWPNTMWPFAPVMGHVAPALKESATRGRFCMAVNTTDGEYCGAGALPTAYPDPHVLAARTAAEVGAEYAFVRLNEQSMTPLGTMQEITAINVIGAGAQWWEPARPMERLWHEWCTRRFGAEAAPAIVSALQKSGTIIRKGLGAGGEPLMDHNGLAVYSWVPRRGPNAWTVFAFPGEPLVEKTYDELATGRDCRAWQMDAHGVELEDFLRNSAEAGAAARDALREIESVRTHLAPQDAEYLTRCFSDSLLMMEAVRVTAVAAAASGRCLREGAERHREEFEKSCAAMEACADRIEAERGMDFQSVHWFLKVTVDGKEYAGYGVPVSLRLLAGIYRKTTVEAERSC